MLLSGTHFISELAHSPPFFLLFVLCPSFLNILRNKVPHLPAAFPGLVTMREWLEALNAMRAAEAVDEERVRQLVFDLKVCVDVCVCVCLDSG